MRLSAPMLKIFPMVARGNNTIEGLAKAQNKSSNWVTEVVQELEGEGFVTKKKNFNLKGSRISIEVSNTTHAIKLKELIFEYATIKFEDILADSKLLFLAALSGDWTDIKTITKLTKISKYRIDRYRPMMKNRGIIICENRLYKINEKMWPELKSFLIAYKNYSLIKGVVKWKYQDETLFEVVDEKMINGEITGLNKYNKYGVSVAVISSLCFLPKRELSKEEVFIHSLFELDEPRTLHLALTFYLKNKLAYNKVLPIAMKYGKYTFFENFIKIIKSKEEKVRLEGMPSFERKDFIRIANIYGVENVQ